MAARRVSKSAIDWAHLAEKIPARQKDAFRNLRAVTDRYVFKSSELPEDLPKIDFAEYTRRITDTAKVKEFEKMYAALKIPYPVDKANVRGQLEQEQKVEEEKMTTNLQKLEKNVQIMQDAIDVIDSIPPPEQMTRQMFHWYFPYAARNPNFDNPGHVPHFVPEQQIDVQMKGNKMMFNNMKHRRFVRAGREFEADMEVKFAEIIEKEKQAKLKGGNQEKPAEK